MTRLQLELLDAVTRKIERDVKGALETMRAIQADHLRFLKRMKKLRKAAKLLLSK